MLGTLVPQAFPASRRLVRSARGAAAVRAGGFRSPAGLRDVLISWAFLQRRTDGAARGFAPRMGAASPSRAPFSTRAEGGCGGKNFFAEGREKPAKDALAPAGARFAPERFAKTAPPPRRRGLRRKMFSPARRGARRQSLAWRIEAALAARACCGAERAAAKRRAPTARASAAADRSRPADWPCRRRPSSPGRRTSREASDWP